MRPLRHLCSVRRVFPSLVALILVCTSFFAVSRPARAQGVYVYGPPPGPPPPPPPRYYYYGYREPPYAFMLAVDVEGAIPLNVPQFSDRNTLNGGGGFKFRVGEQIRLRRWLRITPEIGYGYEHLFATDDFGNAYDWEMDRVFAGARLAFGQIVEPVVYAHLGYGWQLTGDPTVQGASGFAFDLGGALDFHFIPHMNIGAHVEYASVDAQPYAIQWLALGGHADILF
ncbi:MAG: hypothetical protein ABSF69_12950 [Polyangiaceae bacterium]|jgi:hypothetical protein